MICIYDCSYSEGRNSAALKIKSILKGHETVIFRVKENKFPSSIKEYNGFIITGSTKYIDDDIEWMGTLRGLLETKKPVLGICLGHQILADIRGGKIEKMPGERNFGYKKVVLTKYAMSHPLFKGVTSPLLTFFSHRYLVTRLPPDSVLLAKNSRGVQAFQNKNYFGVQFHLEFSWPMAQRLGIRRRMDPGYPRDGLVKKSWEMNKKILRNFAGITENH